MKALLMLVGVFAIVFCPPTMAEIIHVPGDYPTIQAGVNSALNGDMVLVAPGTYVENVNFNGTNLVLSSLYLTTGDTSYISTTIINGNSSGAVITISNGEDSTSQIIGFTIENGSQSGVRVSYADPKIIHNIFRNNSAGNGGAIHYLYGNAIIAYNEFYDNTASQGAAMWIDECSGNIYNNVIYNNLATSVVSGILLYDCDTLTVNNNTICFNEVSSSIPRGGIYIGHFSTQISVYNNILAYNEDCGMAQSDCNPNELSIGYNDIFGNTSGAYWNLSPSPSDLYLDPLLVGGSPFDYHLQAGSPCIDSGDPNSPLDPDGTIADIGAFYFPDPLFIPAIVSGIVVDENTVPIESVLVSSYPYFSALTDLNGLYGLAMMDGTYDITFQKSGYFDYTADDIIAIEGDTTILDVTLYAIQVPCTSCVRGVVENRESAQIESVYVWAVGTGVDDYTDFIGRYSLEGLPEGTYDVSLSHLFYLDTTITNILVSYDSATTRNVLFEGNSAIAGIVVDSTFQPLGGTTVSIGNMDLSSLTDSSGGYFIDRIIPERTFDVLFTHDLYYGEMLNNVSVGVYDTSILDTVIMFPVINEVVVWYGNPDGAPIAAPIGGTILVDVYVQSADYLNLNFLHLPLGTDDQYIADHHSATQGALYYPLTEWDYVQFLPPDELSPGWHSQSLLGFANTGGGPNPYLRCPVPTRIASFALEIVNDTSLIGDTVSCFMEGYNPANAVPLFGDSTGVDPYYPVQFFSPLNFVEPLSNEVFVWYGNQDSTDISAPIGDTILVDIFVQSEDSISLAFLHLPLGTDDQYIVGHHSVTEGVLYYPLTEWDEVNFLAPVELSPGWQSQSLLGFADLWGDPNPYLLCLVPTRIASFALEIVNDSSLVGDTVSCFMEGYHSANGGPLFGDPSGTIPYYPIQFFSNLHLVGPIAGDCQYVPGDVNNSGGYNGLDITFSVIYFKGGQAPFFECECTPGDIWYVSGDVNGSCSFSGMDVTYGVAYFKGGPDPISCPDCPPAINHQGIISIDKDGPDIGSEKTMLRK